MKTSQKRPAKAPQPKPKTREMLTFVIPPPMRLVPTVNDPDGKPMTMLFADFAYALGQNAPHFAGSFSGMCVLKSLVAELCGDGLMVSVPADDLKAIARMAAEPGPNGYPSVALKGGAVVNGKPQDINLTLRPAFEDLHATITALIEATGIEIPTDQPEPLPEAAQ